jgi:hypothetical protein
VRTASDQANVEAFAVRQQNGSRSVLLINKSGGSATIQLKGERGTMASQRLQASLLKDERINISNPISLSPYEVVLLQLPK